MSMYGRRALKITDRDGVWYIPFDGEACRTLLMNIHVDVGSGERFSQQKTVETLDNLYQNGIIDKKQYLSRLPQGLVPQLDDLLQELA